MIYINWTEQPLGQMSDYKLAAILDVWPETVVRRRLKMGIPSYTKSRSVKNNTLLGVIPDQDLAIMQGVSVASIAKARLAQGTPCFKSRRPTRDSQGRRVVRPELPNLLSPSSSQRLEALLHIWQAEWKVQSVYLTHARTIAQYTGVVGAYGDDGVPITNPIKYIQYFENTIPDYSKGTRYLIHAACTGRKGFWTWLTSR